MRRPNIGGWEACGSSAPRSMASCSRSCQRPTQLIQRIHMSTEQLSVSDTIENSEVQFLDDRIYEFNASHTGIADARLIAILVREEDAIIAGLYGWTWGRCCEVKILWVHEQHRARGLGKRLMI